MPFFEYLIVAWLSLNSLILVLLYRKYRNIQGELEVDGYDSFFDEQYKIQGVTKDEYKR
jgi:hypothetical protein